MVCGPDPPENNANDLIPPPRHELMMNGQGDDSDDERQENFGYQPLPQGPDATHSDPDNSDDEDEGPGPQAPQNDVPPIVPMEAELTREVWNAPRSSQSIEMDNERAQQVMSAMANFSLPQTSIPEWAQSINEEQWKQTLKDKLDKLKENR